MFYLLTYYFAKNCHINMTIQFVLGFICYLAIFFLIQQILGIDYLDDCFYYIIVLIIIDVYLWFYVNMKSENINICNNDDSEISESYSDSEDYVISHFADLSDENHLFFYTIDNLEDNKNID